MHDLLTAPTHPYTPTHIHAHTYIPYRYSHTPMHPCIRTPTHPYTIQPYTHITIPYTNLYTNTHIHTYIYIPYTHTPIQPYTPTHPCTIHSYTHTPIHPYTHTLIHPYTNIYTHAGMRLNHTHGYLSDIPHPNSLIC